MVDANESNRPAKRWRSLNLRQKIGKNERSRTKMLVPIKINNDNLIVPVQVITQQTHKPYGTDRKRNLHLMRPVRRSDTQ